MNYWAVFCLVLLNTFSAQAQQRIVDPFFGIELNPNNTHFETIPRSLRNTCSQVRDYDVKKAWVFGHLKTADVEYFILYGYQRVPSEINPKTVLVVPEDDDGLIVAVQGATCRVDQWQYFFRKKENPSRYATPIKAPDEVMNKLAADIFDRYAKALGGKEPFLKQVTKKDREELPPFLAERLEIYERRGQ